MLFLFGYSPVGRLGFKRHCSVVKQKKSIAVNMNKNLPTGLKGALCTAGHDKINFRGHPFVEVPGRIFASPGMKPPLNLLPLFDRYDKCRPVISSQASLCAMASAHGLYE
jgi:hypothetical protein